jgi:hypothetical protein
MSFDSRLNKLELIAGGCSECGGPPRPDTPLEIVVSEAHPDKAQPESEPKRCPYCGRPTSWHIRVRGEAVS